MTLSLNLGTQVNLDSNIRKFFIYSASLKVNIKLKNLPRNGKSFIVLKRDLQTIFIKFWPIFLSLMKKKSLLSMILFSKSLLMINVIFYNNTGNIRVLGQYRINLAESDSGKSCIDNTLCRPCQRLDRMFLTITN